MKVVQVFFINKKRLLDIKYPTNSLPMMETAYFDQNSYQVPLNVRDALKRKMTLELNSDLSKFKKSKYTSLQTPIFQNDVLASPDLQMCKLASPDLENIIQSMPINTPNIFFPKSVLSAEESEGYAGSGLLDDALIRLEKQNQLKNTITTTTTVPTSTQYTTTVHVQQAFQPVLYAPSESMSDDNSLLSESSSAYGGQSYGDGSIKIKSENPNSATSPPISPVDMESQEKIKLERKRQRNRLAASKCRKRKLEKISNLERKVAQLKKENSELALVREKLQKSVTELKEQVMNHVESGCQIMVGQPQF